MNDAPKEITFDLNKCRTQVTGAVDLFYCLAERQYVICGYALPFGYGRFCKHAQRQEFAERPLIDKRINPTQADTSD